MSLHVDGNSQQNNALSRFGFASTGVRLSLDIRLVRRCDWFPSVKTCTQCWYIVLFIFSPPCRKWGDLGTELLVSGAHIVGWCSVVRCLILVRKLPTYRFFHAVYGALYDIDFYHIVELFGMIFRGVRLPSSDSKAGICLRYSSRADTSSCRKT